MTIPVTDSDKNIPADVRIVEIAREPVELYKILKFEGMVTNGGEGKAVVAAGQVMVNGNIETQKRKKIVAGDIIEFNNERIGIKFASEVTTEVSPPKTEAKPIVNEQVEETSTNTAAIDVKENEDK